MYSDRYGSLFSGWNFDSDIIHLSISLWAFKYVRQMKFQIFMAKSIDVPLITGSMNSHSQDIIINNQPILHIEPSFSCLVPVRWLSFSTNKICVDKLRPFEIVFPIKPTEGLNILQISNFLNRTGFF